MLPGRRCRYLSIRTIHLQLLLQQWLGPPTHFQAQLTMLAVLWDIAALERKG